MSGFTVKRESVVVWTSSKSC